MRTATRTAAQRRNWNPNQPNPKLEMAIQKQAELLPGLRPRTTPRSRGLSSSMRSLALFVMLSVICAGSAPAKGQQITVPLPKKNDYTPVQQLNRDGVKALRKHDISKAKRLFYKAYLVDPND